MRKRASQGQAVEVLYPCGWAWADSWAAAETQHVASQMRASKMDVVANDAVPLHQR